MINELVESLTSPNQVWDVRNRGLQASNIRLPQGFLSDFWNIFFIRTRPRECWWQLMTLIGCNHDFKIAVLVHFFIPRSVYSVLKFRDHAINYHYDRKRKWKVNEVIVLSQVRTHFNATLIRAIDLSVADFRGCFYRNILLNIISAVKWWTKVNRL